MNEHQSYSSGNTYSYREKRTKADWAGVSIGDAFKHNIDYYLRLEAQRKFYRMVKKVQMTLARQTGDGDPGPPRIKPQISPFYTNYPSILAAHTAIGLTGYLEFEARVKVKILFTHLAHYLKNPAAIDQVKVAPEIYQKLAWIAANCVQTRLLLEDLSRLPSASPIEIYRLFSASQQSLKFRSVPEIIRGVILYGDILPDWQEQKLHPMTRSILKDVTEASCPFLDVLPRLESSKIVAFGAEWVRAVCLSLAKYLPEPKINDMPKIPKGLGKTELANILSLLKQREQEKQYKFRAEPNQESQSDRIAPLNDPKPPSLFDPVNIPDQVMKSILNTLQDQKEQWLSTPNVEQIHDNSHKQTLINFMRTVERAGAQQRNWEDMRSDIIERTLGVSGFVQSPIQGNPADGHEVSISLGDDRTGSGEIFDRPMELSDDLPAYEKLLEESNSITQALRRTLYPNLEQVPVTERFRSSGSLDPGRLAMADISSAVFRRYRIHEKAAKRGSPLLLIACDGSGSLKENQIKMLKLLTAAWLNSTAKTKVQVMAGLYHSGQIRQGLTGPLVQWIYHPQKTPATSRRDASRALISLPPVGTGAQSDALSLAFMLEDAYQVARGKMVYLILITDCKWNRSFRTRKQGREEVYAYFQKAYEKFAGKLHTTLVALGVMGKIGFEDIVDKIITVSPPQLQDYSTVAGKIGIYVASCMKERHKLIVAR